MFSSFVVTSDTVRQDQRGTVRLHQPGFLEELFRSVVIRQTQVTIDLLGIVRAKRLMRADELGLVGVERFDDLVYQFVGRMAAGVDDKRRD